MEDFYNTKFGPTLILENKIIIANNLRNRIKTHFKKKNCEKFFITLYESCEKWNECNRTETSNFLCRSTHLKVFNYWKYASIHFEMTEICFKDASPYRVYSFLSLEINRKDNKIFIKSKERDLVMLFLTIDEIVLTLKEAGLSVDIRVNNKKVENSLEFWIELCEYKEVVLVTNGNEDMLTRLLLYPVINEKEVTMVFKN